MMDYGWRAFIVQQPGDWHRDEISLMIGHRTPEGLRVVRPTTLELGEPIPASYGPASNGEQTDPSLVLPTELAACLFGRLAPHLLAEATADADLVATIQRLTRERDRVTSQLEKLIDGIGRLGGNNA